MTDISIIILTRDEKLHMRRCLERLTPLDARQIFIVDSMSTDGTQKIAKEFGATVIEHKWPGNQAVQFNWALDNLPIEAGWVLRLDADEWLTMELISEIKKNLPRIDDNVAGVVLKRRHVVGWLGNKWIKHGMYPTRILRIFRSNCARYDERMAMDEHLIVKGCVVEFDNDFVDESLISFDAWKSKHRSYARREARMALSGTTNQNKRIYYKLPPYFRAFVYFGIRYFLKLGLLDGIPGFRWHFWQGLWYRCLVDREIGKARRSN